MIKQNKARQDQISYLIRSMRVPLLFIVLIWIIHIIKFSSNLSLGGLGVYPRDIRGAIGILTAPLIHGDWKHLVSNTLPLLALGMIIFAFYKSVAFRSFLLIYVITGIAVWLFARPVHHIGASGVVYGLVSFVFWNGVFRRNIKSITLALIITVMYSGYFLGIVPGQEGISWESHLFGALAGILVSFIFKDVREPDEVKVDPFANESTEQRYFLPRDTFDETIKERESDINPRSPWTTDRTW